MNNQETFIGLLISIIIILMSAKLFGHLFTFLRQPKVVGEMLAGVLLGPTCLGYFFPALASEIFPKSQLPFLFILGNLGLSFYMFIVALELDFSLVDKKMLKQSGWLSFFIIVAPFALGLLFGVIYFDLLKGAAGTLSFGIFLGASLAITAFPILARILQENGLLKTRMGTIVTLSASIQDVVSWIMLAVVLMMIKGSSASGFKTIIGAPVYLLLMFLLIKPLLAAICRRFFRKEGDFSGFFSFTVILILASALASDYLDLHSVFGGFVLGLIFPRDKKMVEPLIIRIKDMIITLLLPLFFCFSGLNANLLILQDLGYLVPCMVLVVFSFIGKYLPSLIIMRMNHFSLREASAVGGLMNARGLMELIIANIGLTYNIISKELYSMIILVALLSTIIAMPIYNISMRRRFSYFII